MFHPNLTLVSGRMRGVLSALHARFSGLSSDWSYGFDSPYPVNANAINRTFVIQIKDGPMFMRAQTAGPVAVGFEGNLLVDFTAVAALLGTGITIVSATVALSTQSSGLTVIASTVDPSGTKVAIRVSATSAGSAQITVTPTYNDPAQTVDPRTITVNIVNALG